MYPACGWAASQISPGHPRPKPHSLNGVLREVKAGLARLGLQPAGRGTHAPECCSAMQRRSETSSGFGPIPFESIPPFRAAVCARNRMCGSRVLSQTLDRPSLPCTPYGIREDAQRSPRFRETPTRSFAMTLTLEATVGFEPTHGGFADPCLSTWLRRRRSHQPAGVRSQPRRDTPADGRPLKADGFPERAMGFEPTTFSLARRRTTTVLRPQWESS